MAELGDLQHDYNTAKRQYLLALGALLLLLIIGAVAYRYMLNLSWISAFYFCVITLATVGYGDITPTTDASRVFTIFYVIIGIGIFTAFARQFIQHGILRRELRQAKRKNSK